MRELAAPIDFTVKKYPLNAAGRDFVVGDIHGAFSLLQQKLDSIGFNPIDGDRLFAVGDLVDRGPESYQAWEWLEKPWFTSVRGNHCDMALSNPTLLKEDPLEIQLGYYDMRNGMKWWKESSWKYRKLNWFAFQKLPIVIEVKTEKGLVGIVHSEVPYFGSPGMKAKKSWQEFLLRLQMMPREVAEEVMWTRTTCEYNDKTEIEGVWRVYSGHTPVDTPKMLGNQCFIDTGGCFKDGYFTVMELTAEILPETPLRNEGWPAL